MRGSLAGNFELSGRRIGAVAPRRIRRALRHVPPVRVRGARYAKRGSALSRQAPLSAAPGFSERVDDRIRRQIAGQRGTAYGWVLSAAAVLILSVMLFGAGRASRNLPTPLDEHSQPAVRIPVKMVAVNEEGKTFHLPTCSYLHGKWKLIPAEEAVRLGYNPCIRCMKDALPQPLYHGAMEPRPEPGSEPATTPGRECSHKDGRESVGRRLIESRCARSPLLRGELRGWHFFFRKRSLDANSRCNILKVHNSNRLAMASARICGWILIACRSPC